MNKEKEFKSHITFLREFAASGGRARAKKLTSERKSEIARMGGKAKGKKK